MTKVQLKKIIFFAFAMAKNFSMEMVFKTKSIIKQSDSRNPKKNVKFVREFTPENIGQKFNDYRGHLEEIKQYKELIKSTKKPEFKKSLEREDYIDIVTIFHLKYTKLMNFSLKSFNNLEQEVSIIWNKK